MLNHKRTLIAAVVSLSLIGCGERTTQTEINPELTAQDAKQFLQQAQDDVAKMQVPAAHAEWSYATNINFDTAAVSAYFNEVLSTKVAKLAKEAAKFNDVDVDADTRRAVGMLKKNHLTPPPPSRYKKSRTFSKNRL